MKLLNSLCCVLFFGVGGGMAYSNLLLGLPIAFPAWYQPYGVVAYLALGVASVCLMSATNGQVIATGFALVMVGAWPMWVVYLPQGTIPASMQSYLAVLTLACPIIYAVVGLARYVSMSAPRYQQPMN